MSNVSKRIEELYTVMSKDEQISRDAFHFLCGWFRTVAMDTTNPAGEEFLKALEQLYIDEMKLAERENLKKVKQDGYAIQYIENPSEEIQLEAVKQAAKH